MQKITTEQVEELRNQNPPMPYHEIAKLFNVTKMTAYNYSKKGKQKLKEYQQSDRFKANQKKYTVSKKGKESRKKWLQTEAGKASLKKKSNNDVYRLNNKHAHHIKANKVFNNCELCKK